MANTERECRDRDIEDLREDIGWLQKRITEINIALDETRDNMRVLCEATQLDMAADETHQTMKVLAETVQFYNQQVSQARADNELLHQRNQELRRLIRDAKQRQWEEDEAATSIDPHHHSRGRGRDGGRR